MKLTVTIASVAPPIAPATSDIPGDTSCFFCSGFFSSTGVVEAACPRVSVMVAMIAVGFFFPVMIVKISMIRKKKNTQSGDGLDKFREDDAVMLDYS
jgi:hypothetical protein